MTPTGTPLLSGDWLSHSGDESEHVLLLSARPILDRGRSQIDIAICAGRTLAPAVCSASASASVRGTPSGQIDQTNPPHGVCSTSTE